MACFSSSDAGAAENISMTLTELSVFMKKQELELQLRTEKEKEKEEGEFLSCRNTFMYIVSKFKPQGLKSTQDNVAVLLKKKKNYFEVNKKEVYSFPKSFMWC